MTALLQSYLGLEARYTYDEMRARVCARLSVIGEGAWPAAAAFEALLGATVDSEQWQALEPRVRRQHTLEALTRVILRESQVQPLLLILEDLHWIDAETQAWLDALVDALPAARLLLLVTYRPEYQHGWGRRTYYTQLRVDPLLRDGAEDLLLALMGTDADLVPLRTRLAQRTDGNPFFLEESALTAAGHLPSTRELIEQTIDVRLDLRHTIHPLGEMERAMGLLREAEPLAERLGDKRRLGQISLALSIALWMTGSAADAQSPGDRAVALAEAIDDRLLAHQTRGHLPRLHHDRGDYRRAIVGLRECLSALEVAGESPIAFGLSPLMSNATAYLGWSLAELGDFAEAVRLTEEALRRAEASGTPLGLIMACMGVGLVRVRQGNILAALPTLERGLEVCFKFGLTALNYHGVAASLGWAYALADRTAEAIPLLRRVADQVASMKLVSDHLLGVIPLAEVWLATGKFDDAAALGRPALELARTHGQRGHEVYALRLLGAVAARRDPVDVAEAESHYRPALELAQELGMRPLVAHCHLGLGRFRGATGKPGEAREQFATAIALYREMDMRFWLG